MVIWPQTITKDDAGWLQTCALLKTLALDPRRLDFPRKGPAPFFETADDFLERPMIWVDRKLVAAPYFSYSLRFAVSAVSIGHIPVDRDIELAEFREAVNSALQGPLTQAERKRWEASQASYQVPDPYWLKDEEQRAANAFRKQQLAAIAAEEGQKAIALYRAAQRRLPCGSLEQHKDTLLRLIEKGLSMLAWYPAVMDT